MKTVKIETKLCLMCMEEHEVQTVILENKEKFKGEQVVFNAMYEYCSKSNEYLETQEMIKSNSLSMKDAYREKVGLLTSKQLILIRNKYSVSQKDFSTILDWGGSTISIRKKTI